MGISNLGQSEDPLLQDGSSSLSGTSPLVMEAAVGNRFERLFTELNIEPRFHRLLAELSGGETDYLRDIDIEDLAGHQDSHGIVIPKPVARGLVRKLQATHQHPATTTSVAAGVAEAVDIASVTEKLSALASQLDAHFLSTQPTPMDRWHQLPKPSWPAMAFGSSVAIQSSILLMGGCQLLHSREHPAHNGVWRSDDLCVSWTQLPEPGWCARCHHAAVALDDGSVLVLGGRRAFEAVEPLGDVWRSRDRGKTWDQIETSLPQPCDHAPAVVSEGKVLVLGGFTTNGSVLRTAWRSSDAGDTWHELPEPPWAARWNPAAVAMGRSILLMGGSSSSGQPLCDVWRSDDSGETWRQLPQPPWSARIGPRAVVVGRSVILTGGFDAHGGLGLQDVWCTHDMGIAWLQLPKPHWYRRGDHCCVQIHGTVFVLSGCMGETCIKDAWYSQLGMAVVDGHDRVEHAWHVGQLHDAVESLRKT